MGWNKARLCQRRECEAVSRRSVQFIICTLRNDIFIIDQHATDEKFRFEQFMKNYKIKTQKLLIPKYVSQITRRQELAIMQNFDIFEANGFGFEISADQKPKIISLPMSLNPQSKVSHQFADDEILELATMLSQNENENRYHHMVRPAKVRSVFASKACRSAIMIGKALTCNEMRVVVDNICLLDQPWNCPHGRPT